MKYCVFILFFLIINVYGDRQVKFEVDNFESVIEKMDNAKNTEELMLLHREFHSFLRDRFLSRKDLSNEELLEMKQLLTGQLLKDLVDRYKVKIDDLRESQRGKYDELRIDGVSPLRDYNLKIYGLMRRKKVPMEHWDDPKKLHELLYKAPPTDKQLAWRGRIKAEQEEKAKYLADLKAQGIEPIADTVVYELSAHNDEPGFRYAYMDDYAKVYKKAVQEKNQKQLDYMLDYRFVKDLYPDYRRLVKYWKIRMDKQEFAELVEKIGCLQVPFEKVIIRQGLIVAKEKSEWKQEQLDKRKEQIRKDDKNKPRRVADATDKQRVQAELTRCESILKSGDKDKIADVCFFGYGLHLTDAKPQMKKAILDNWGKLVKEDFINRLLDIIAKLKNDDRNHFVFENGDFVLFMPKADWTTEKRDRDQEWLTIKGVQLRYDKEADRYYLDKTAEYRNQMSYLVEFK